MRYRLLGRSGLRVSEAALGTMTFGASIDWGADRDTSKAIFDAFAHAGGNFVDTADIYTNGESEELLGEFIASDRSHFVLATKYTDAPLGQKASHPNAAGNSRKRMVEAVEASLRRLGTDYIDLFYVHAWDFMTPIEEVLRGLDDLVRQGKVLYLGISDAPVWVVSRADAIAELRGWSRFVALQIEYSLVERTPERELLPMAQALGLTPVAWSPLASGILTGKYTSSNGQADGGRLEKAAFKQIGEREQHIAEAVQEVADAVGRHPAHVALAWVRQRGAIPIFGATKPSQMESNLQSLDLTLEDAHLRTLEEASAIELGFPHDFLTGTQAVTYGGYFDEIVDEPQGAPLAWR